MLIDERFRKCVAFIYADMTNQDTLKKERKPVATAFFVSMVIGNDEGALIYAVTARHVIEASRPYGHLYFRVNTAGGQFQDFETDQDDWVAHHSTDVAVTHIVPRLRDFDLHPIDLDMLATDKYILQNEVDIGDSVFFVGLFEKYAGIQRIQPIIRFGNISLMPHEKIPVKLDPGSNAITLVHAYLVEARSWGGHSGSPAFIYYPVGRRPDFLEVGVESPALLGLVHGHYEIEKHVAFVGDIVGRGQVPINAGMAIVVPAQKIIDTLMQEELVDERTQILDGLRRDKPIV